MGSYMKSVDTGGDATRRFREVVKEVELLMEDETRIGEESRCNDVKGLTHVTQSLQRVNWKEVEDQIEDFCG